MPEPRTSTMPLPEAVTKPLLDRIIDQAVDQDFRVAADRRTAQGVPEKRREAGVWTLVAVLVFGGLVAVAAVQTSRDADVRETSREELINRIDQRQKQVADLHRQIARLSNANDARDRRLTELTDQYQQESAQEAALAESTGFAPVAGAGIKIMIDDSEDGKPEGEVRDTDLATLIDGLWEAGATAVSVDGQRVTPRSGLTTSGSVLRMNDMSLSPPYDVLALGDPRTLSAHFADSQAGQAIMSTVGSYHMGWHVDSSESLSLPAAAEDRMRLTVLAPDQDGGADGKSDNTSKSKSGEDSE